MRDAAKAGNEFTKIGPTYSNFAENWTSVSVALGNLVSEIGGHAAAERLEALSQCVAQMKVGLSPLAFVFVL